MLSVIKQIECMRAFDQSGAPDKFQKVVKISFEEMDNSEASDLGFSWVFLYHDVDCVAPAGHWKAAINCNVKEISKALKESGIVCNGFVVSQVTSRRQY